MQPGPTPIETMNAASTGSRRFTHPLMPAPLGPFVGVDRHAATARDRLEPSVTESSMGLCSYLNWADPELPTGRPRLSGPL
jgi:hypothetical protein